MPESQKFQIPIAPMKLAAFNCPHIETEAFLNIGIKSGLSGGTGLTVFLQIFSWLDSAEFQKIVGCFSWFYNKSVWF